MQRRLRDLGIKPASPAWRLIILTTLVRVEKVSSRTNVTEPLRQKINSRLETLDRTKSGIEWMALTTYLSCLQNGWVDIKISEWHN